LFGKTIFFVAGNPAAMVILEELEAAVQRGLRSKRLQQAPHLVGESQKRFHIVLFEPKIGCQHLPSDPLITQMEVT